MKKKRLVPLVLYRNGEIVQARQFSEYRNLGLIGPTLKRFSDWDADELVVVDISTEPESSGRGDLRNKFRSSFLDALAD